MSTLHVEHKVTDFNAWKKVFDADPAERKKNGVRSYRVNRAVDDPNYIMMDLEFDSTDTAKAFLGKLRKVWQTPQAAAQIGEGTPQVHIAETVETKTL
ncbi:MAG TPA: hypothetical protein DGG94_09380 [Micromonosporaceae bacterium]|nr:hypothetical protein [Micromonosporaceae bacterium]HCU49994.1 hypothetical protein [Micromonosporaceae bacterium]